MERTDGKLEFLEHRVEDLLLESKDYYFTEYLQKLMVRLREQKYQIDLLTDELDRSYQLYLQRNPQTVEKAPAVSEENVSEASIAEPSVVEASVSDASLLNMSGQNRPVYNAAAQYTPTTNALQQQQNTSPPVNNNKKNAEFIIGTILFSIIGVSFILTAFVLFGMNFMNSFIKGISLYAVCLLLLLFSGFYLARKDSKIELIVSSIGIGGLYLTTVINYLYLKNINALAAILITAFITVGTLLLSRKKESGLLRCIGIIACYLCVFPIQNGMTNVEFIVITVIIFFINLMCFALPVKKSALTLGVLHMLSNALFCAIFIARSADLSLNQVMLLIFTLTSFVVFNIIYVLTDRAGDMIRAEGKPYDKVGVITAFYISAFIFVTILSYILCFYPENDGTNVKHLGVAAAGIICLVFFLIERKRNDRWIQYITFNLIAFGIYGFFGTTTQSILCIFIMLVAAKALTWVKALQSSEAVITIIACLAALIYWEQPLVYLLIAGLALSLLLLHRRQTFYEISIVITLVIFMALKLPALIKLPSIVGLLFISFLLFHNLPRCKGKGIQVYNYIALSIQVICFLLLADNIYRWAYITYLMMLIFGLATILLTFHKKYEMDFRFKYIILAMFLTYMAFISRTGIPILTSILLMVVALLSVAVGFVFRKKSVRVYGLILSLFVCGKVIIYDFIGISTFNRMILFFVVGIIALVISGSYILLEKRNSNLDESDRG